MKHTRTQFQEILPTKYLETKSNFILNAIMCVCTHSLKIYYIAPPNYTQTLKIYLHSGMVTVNPVSFNIYYPE